MKATIIISVLAVVSLLSGLGLSCSPFDSPYFTEDEVCSLLLTSLPRAERGTLIASAEYQGDHIWRFEAYAQAQGIRVVALFYERTGVVDWVRWDWPVLQQPTTPSGDDWTSPEYWRRYKEQG